MNMVVHDLRNPSEAIYQGLTQGKQIINNEFSDILADLNEELVSQYHDDDSQIIHEDGMDHSMFKHPTYSQNQENANNSPEK